MNLYTALARRQGSAGISGCREGCRRFRSALFARQGLQKFVIPAKAGIQCLQTPAELAASWMPAWAGMTGIGFSRAACCTQEHPL